MRIILPLALLLALSFAGCSKTQGEKGPISSQVAPVVHVPTPDDWKTALKGSYVESQVQDEDDGVVKFMANFKNEGGPLTFGTHDAFRKLRVYKAGMPMHINTDMKAYVSVIDNERPVLFVQPYFWGRDGFLFLKKFAVMVDGDVILEHECQNVQHGKFGVGVTELCDAMMSQDEIKALRKISDSSKVLVRLSGDKGYINLESKKKFNETDEFKRDIQSAVRVYDSIDLAIKDHLPPKLVDANSKLSSDFR